MAKTHFILLCIFLTTLCDGTVGQSIGRDTAQINKVRKIYTSLIGVKEATGHNDGPMVEKILASARLKKGDPWCAATVCYTFINAGVKAIISGYCPNWFPKSKVIYTRNGKCTQVPFTADVFGIWFANMGRIAHEGFVDYWPQNSPFLITVEGNTNKDGSREGNLCAKKRRLKSQISNVSRWI